MTEQGKGNREQGVRKAAPLRGTQSFVGVMVEVWKRPRLTGTEVLWRLVAWLPVLVVVGVELGGGRIRFHPELLGSITVFKPVEAIAGLTKFFGVLAPLETVRSVCWGLGMVAFWVVVSAFGRARILRRMDAGLSARMGTLLALGALRTGALLAVVTGWAAGCGWVVKAMVLGPAARHVEPNLVGAFALIVSGTLVLFVLWCMVSWVLQLAPLMAMAKGDGVVPAVRDALRNGPLRGKLMEINLVMGIVKVCVIVLGMVLSACPLPFETVESQAFLFWWTVGAVGLYLLATDYFQVVRSAAYLRLWERSRV